MKLGLSIGYAGPQLNTTVQGLVNMEKIGEVERLGYDSIWTAESWGNDAVTPLAWVGSQTSTIKLGTGIMQLPGRSPANAVSSRQSTPARKTASTVRTAMSRRVAACPRCWNRA